MSIQYDSSEMKKILSEWSSIKSEWNDNQMNYFEQNYIEYFRRVVSSVEEIGEDISSAMKRIENAFNEL